MLGMAEGPGGGFQFILKASITDFASPMTTDGIGSTKIREHHTTKIYN